MVENSRRACYNGLQEQLVSTYVTHDYSDVGSSKKNWVD